ncbi:uncharacterized protein METZ01_LOCUS230967, partial [marine metagenome]
MLPILLLSSCYKSTEWEDVTADYDPVLNVMGIISLDDNIDSFVGVYRTTELTETSLIFSGIVDTSWWYDYEEDTVYTWLDSLYEPAGVIDSAVVTIFTNTDTYVFEFDSDTRKYKYSGFTPSEETTYNLTIDVNGFDPVTGQLITPSMPHIDSSLNDTLPSSSTYSINWVNSQTSAEYGILRGELVESYAYCGGDFYEVVEFASEEYTIFPQWCNPKDISVGDIDNDYGIISESECICDNYRIWDQVSETCICDDENLPVLENDEEAVVVFGGCESAVNEYGCDHTFDDETFLYEYCPVTCGGCEFIAEISAIACEKGLWMYCPETCGVCAPDDVTPLEDRNWIRFDLSNYLESDINLFQTDYGYCGDGNPDYETIRIRL